jgi:hypothetical protein
MILKKRQRERIAIERFLTRVWPKHKAFVRRHVCVVPGCISNQIECAHYRTAGNSGAGLKPADWFTFPCCHTHHAEQHQIGQPAFERKYGIDLAAVCAEYAKRSTDVKMKETMRSADAS